jgi:hypothetical protein
MIAAPGYIFRISPDPNKLNSAESENNQPEYI